VFGGFPGYFDSCCRIDHLVGYQKLNDQTGANILSLLPFRCFIDGKERRKHAERNSR